MLKSAWYAMVWPVVWRVAGRAPEEAVCRVATTARKNA